MNALWDGLEYEVRASTVFPDSWVVEAINHASEGEIYMATFTGPGAQDRAREYAAWKNLSNSWDKL